ncbi:MAG: hypothetical protein QOH93_2237 [Chloroflexia bacterium]|jgi:hypothetical protein|nr:hypothetical protein [Chloroflexia bacterium]
MRKISYMGDVPGPLNVQCPRCGGKAEYDLPFDLYTAAQGEPPSEDRPLHRWGGWLVAEKYPSVKRWHAAAEGISESDGIVKCSQCHLVAEYTLRWPHDAYYQWDIRGNTLWAFNLEHARVLGEFLGSKDRDVTRFPQYARSLMKIPGELLSAKVRDDIATEISNILRREAKR